MAGLTTFLVLVVSLLRVADRGARSQAKHREWALTNKIRMDLMGANHFFPVGTVVSDSSGVQVLLCGGSR